MSPDAMDNETKNETKEGRKERRSRREEASFTEAPLFIFLGLLSPSLKLGMVVRNE